VDGEWVLVGGMWMGTWRECGFGIALKWNGNIVNNAKRIPLGRSGRKQWGGVNGNDGLNLYSK